MVDRSRIRVKAMAHLVDPARGRELVTRYPPDLDRPVEFHRLVGGSVEFGESALEAVRREVHEELELLLDPDAFTPLGAVENRFEFEDAPGHEIDFVFRADVRSDLVADAGAWFAEDDGLPMRVEWRALDSASPVPLYPDGLDQSPWRGIPAVG